jgi:predicted cation transporter
MPQNIEQLLAFVLALSLVTERIVAFVKQVVPALDEGAGAVDLAKAETRERGRRVSVQLLAVGASAVVLNLMEPSATIAVGGREYPIWFLAILGSGGSSFWSQILGFTRAARDLKRVATVQTVNEELTRAQQPPTTVMLQHGKFVTGVATGRERT